MSREHCTWFKDDIALSDLNQVPRSGSIDALRHQVITVEPLYKNTLHKNTWLYSYDFEVPMVFL
jgi:hypothetical protein